MRIGKLEGIEPSETLVIYDKVRRLRSEGRTIIDLSGGQPDFPTPANIKEAAKKALDDNYTFYSESSGLLELRRAVADKLRREQNIDVSPVSEIIVTLGGKEALFAALQATISPGDEILITDPCYVSYKACIQLAGGIPISVPLKEENDFKISYDNLAKAITPRTRMVVLNSPHNPTGCVLTKKELEGLAEVVRQNNLLVLSDEVYEKLVYDGTTHHSIASLPDMFQRTIILNSFSKTYAMTGWRLGYVIADEEIMKHISLVHQHMVTCASTFAQRGALEALQGSQDSVKDMLEEYQRRRDFVVGMLEKMTGVSCRKPMGAFYAFPNVSRLGLSSQELTETLLEEGNVAVMPGSAFGDEGEGYLRICFAKSLTDLATALANMNRVIERKIAI